jgi:hypothetical protein
MARLGYAFLVKLFPPAPSTACSPALSSKKDGWTSYMDQRHLTNFHGPCTSRGVIWNRWPGTRIPLEIWRFNLAARAPYPTQPVGKPRAPKSRMSSSETRVKDVMFQKYIRDLDGEETAFPIVSSRNLNSW